VNGVIVGLGPHGKRILSVVKEMKEVELTAVVDQRIESIQNVDLPDTIRCYKSIQELWPSNRIDLMCIATNGPSHAMIAMEAMSRGVRYIMVEKPMACSVSDCDRMLDAAIKTQTRLSVDQSRRHDPMYRWLRDQIKMGTWGSPRCIWIQRPGIGLGCLATHSFDLVRFLTGLEINRISAWVDNPIKENPRGNQFIDPGGLVIMEMGANLRAVIAQIEDGSGPMSIEMDFTGARLRLDEKSGSIEIIERDLTVKTGPGQPPVFIQKAVPDGMTAKINMEKMLKGVLEELISDRPMDCDALHGRIAVQSLVAAYVSHRDGHVPVTLSKLSLEDKERCLPVT
jgi:predicted dehydrogenase